jgi:hypothetical protein
MMDLVELLRRPDGKTLEFKRWRTRDGRLVSHSDVEEDDDT